MYLGKSKGSKPFERYDFSRMENYCKKYYFKRYSMAWLKNHAPNEMEEEFDELDSDDNIHGERDYVLYKKFKWRTVMDKYQTPPIIIKEKKGEDGQEAKSPTLSEKGENDNRVITYGRYSTMTDLGSDEEDETAEFDDNHNAHDDGDNDNDHSNHHNHHPDGHSFPEGKQEQSTSAKNLMEQCDVDGNYPKSDGPGPSGLHYGTMGIKNMNYYNK